MSSIASTPYVAADPTNPKHHVISMTISGGPESGKTTAVHAITNVLAKAGFFVHVLDDIAQRILSATHPPASGPEGHQYEIQITTIDSSKHLAPPPGPCCRSVHQQRVDDFMRRAGQDVPTRPTVPPPDVLILRAKLIFEEALETIRGLGVVINHINGFGAAAKRDITIQNQYNAFEFLAAHPPNMLEIVDGCADLKVVTTGTLSACGVSDMAVQQEVDEANLRKFGPGGYRAGPNDPKGLAGKWIKPLDWNPPDITRILAEQSA